MMFDSSNGTWIIHGRRKELYQMYYNFRATVFHPKENKVMTSIASDPYARSLAADGRRAHIFDVENDASAKPEGWETFAKPSLNHICEGGIYELHAGATFPPWMIPCRKTREGSIKHSRAKKEEA